MQTPQTDVRDIFHRHGLRHTRQRELVYSALMASVSHPTADDLFATVCARDRALSLATVYNALEALTEAGLARRIVVDSTAARYDADMSHHIHVVTSDGRVVDVPPELGKRLLESFPKAAFGELESRLGVIIEGVTLHARAGDGEAANTDR